MRLDITIQPVAMRGMISIVVVLCSSWLTHGVQVDHLKVEKKVQQESVLDKVHNVLVSKHAKALALIQNMQKDNAKSKVYNQQKQKELQDFWAKAREDGKKAGQAYEEYQEVKRTAALSEVLLEEDAEMLQKAQELLDKEQEKIAQSTEQAVPKPKHLKLKKSSLIQQSEVEALEQKVKRLEAENTELRHEVTAALGPEEIVENLHHYAIKAGQEASRVKETMDNEKYAAMRMQSEAPSTKPGYHYNPYLEKVKDVSGTAFATVSQIKKDLQDTMDHHGLTLQQLKENQANKLQQYENMPQMERVKEMWSDKKVITDTGRFAQELQTRHRTNAKPASPSAIGAWSTPVSTAK